MSNKVDMCYIIDSGLNFSDHLPLVLGCQLSASPLSACQSSHGTKGQAPVQKPKRYRWDKADLMSYYFTPDHYLWQVCDRPRSGPIYRERCHARAEYRRAMRYKSKMANVRISNYLHDQLLTKDCTSFRRMWKNKVNNRRTIASQVDGYSDDSGIATVFAKRFHQACLPNSLERNAGLRLKFEAKLNSYSSNSDLQWISFDLVDKCVRDMKLGKAPGIDGTEAEHLRYAHPRICVILALLFNAIIIHGVVPSMFGLGIVVPLIIGHNLDDSISENYSTHISKFLRCVSWTCTALILLRRTCSLALKRVWAAAMPLARSGLLYNTIQLAIPLLTYVPYTWLRPLIMLTTMLCS